MAEVAEAEAEAETRVEKPVEKTAENSVAKLDTTAAAEVSG